ncbi:WD40-repeat-containing domain protein [Gongronella butleri]|nr:WD40-repeat-containing domain protein [Gongronella butleri]
MDANLQPLHDELAKLEIKHKWKTVQAVPDKVTNCLFHPSKSKLLGIVTDNSGSMAFWDVEAEDEDGDPVVYKYRPSLSSIGNAQFSKHDPSTLYLSSFDGTMKIWDMNKLTFTDIPMKNESPLSYFDLWDDANMVAFGTAFGELGFLDRRSGVETSYDIRGHNKKIGCVSVNPKHTHLVAAACNDRTVTIWDRRNIKVDEPLQELAHGYAVTSAYFSPTGKQLSTASYDDLLRVFDLNDAQELTLRGRIKHNCHVGKWVPLFRARWNQNVRFGLEHPHFVVGNMMRPINIFSSETMRKVHDLYDPDHITAVQAVNDFHPNLDRLVVISGNGGGKVVCYT